MWRGVPSGIPRFFLFPWISKLPFFVPQGNLKLKKTTLTLGIGQHILSTTLHIVCSVLNAEKTKIK